jgi:hypothetical protein
MADLYASKPPIAVQMIKHSTNELAHALGSAIMHMDTDQNLLSASTRDRAAAIDAQRHQQPGKFIGD